MANDIVKGRGGKNNFGTSNKTALAKDSAFVGKMVREVYVAYKQPKVKSNAELAERLDKYFNTALIIISFLPLRKCAFSRVTQSRLSGIGKKAEHTRLMRGS